MLMTRPTHVKNPYRGTDQSDRFGSLRPSTEAEAVTQLLDLCPAHQPTAMASVPALAEQANVAALWVKDERTRMGLGSFKALGAAYCIARDAAAVRAAQPDVPWEETLTGRAYVTASAGNHGLSLAAGARLFGAKAVIYLAETVPEPFAERLRGIGAEVVRAGHDYEASMAAAASAAETSVLELLSDSSWPGYTDRPYHVMEGYTQMAYEAVAQLEEVPSHILLQAGVGGLAAAVAAYARRAWGDVPQIIVVEPEHARALIGSIEAGTLTETPGPVSEMGRLDCKAPSMVALAGLAHDADAFVPITEEQAADGAAVLAQHGLETTASGGAGLAALLAGVDGVGRDARVLCILSEGPEDG